MTTQKSSNVTVILKNGVLPRLCLFCLERETFLEGEFFTSQSSDNEWFGFYDWLRKVDGSVIGINLRPDEGEIDSGTLSYLVSLDMKNTVDTVYIFFGPDRDFDPTLSDDTDFGGNVLLHGNLGTLAITFNAPVQR